MPRVNRTAPWENRQAPALSRTSRLLSRGCSCFPRIDPLRKNYAAFRDWYDGFILAFVLFMLAIQCQVILRGPGHRISMNLVMPVLVGLLFLYCGFFLERVEPDWFAGIRTPWTISSPAVWKKTHMPGGKLFKVAGIVSCAGSLVPDRAATPAFQKQNTRLKYHVRASFSRRVSSRRIFAISFLKAGILSVTISHMTSKSM